MLKLNNFILVFLFLICGCKNNEPDIPKTVDSMDGIEATVSSVKSYLVDSLAIDETAILFYNLKNNSKKGIMLGQQTAFTGRYSTDGISYMSDMKLTTGKHPFVIGNDFLFITNKNNTGTSNNWYYQQEVRIINDIKYSYRQGLVNTMSWHFMEPYNKSSFKASDINDDILAKAFRSILVGGENHEYYKDRLRKVASVFKSLIDDKGNLIPIIFRPFHEFDGTWFWWSSPAYATPEQFKQNWQFTVHYLRDSLGVHNVLYAFSPDKLFSNESEYLRCYPGDEYVDILGMDNYQDYSKGIQTGIESVSSKLKIISDLAIKKKKVAALTEFGYLSTNATIDNLYTKCFLPAFQAQKVEISYAMFWTNTSTDYYVPIPSITSPAKDFLQFINSGTIYLQGDLPNFYSFPVLTK